MADVPPPPPPHGEHPKTSSGLPDGNYDIFIIPPHSSGSGFLYLPSFQCNQNSFVLGYLAGITSVAAALFLIPLLKQFVINIAASGGAGVVALVIGVGVAAWAFGKTQGESARDSAAGGSGPPPNAGAGSGQYSYNTHNAHSGPHTSGAPPPRPPPGYTSPPPPPPPPQDSGYRTEYSAPPPPRPQSPPPPPPPRPATPPYQAHSAPPPPPQSPKSTSDAWDRAREETRKREEAKKKAEELRRMREEAAKRKEEADRLARRAAEKIRWEQNRAREKEARELEARRKLDEEKTAKEREAREKEAREREARERIQKTKAEFEKAARAKEAAAAKATPPSSPEKKYERPTARSSVSTATSETSYRPNPLKTSTSYFTESSYAPSVSTARTSPPPEYRGPYKTTDPDKVVIKGVYRFNNMWAKPDSSLVSGEGSVSDGLILRITTEGLFIDDDRRGVPQREWDVKAWTIKLIETGEMRPFNILRATVRDQNETKYVFVLSSEQNSKVDVGLERLRKGKVVRSMHMGGLKEPAVAKVLGELNYVV